MTRPNLDLIDREILRVLQTDARISNVDMAKRLGLSAPPVLRRWRRLERLGYITRYIAITPFHPSDEARRSTAALLRRLANQVETPSQEKQHDPQTPA